MLRARLYGTPRKSSNIATVVWLILTGRRYSREYLLRRILNGVFKRHAAPCWVASGISNDEFVLVPRRPVRHIDQQVYPCCPIPTLHDIG